MGNYYVQQTRVVPMSGLAVAGFIFALIGAAPLGLILSLAAFGKTRSGERSGNGFAVAGAILGGLGTLGWFVVIMVLIGASQAANSALG